MLRSWVSLWLAGACAWGGMLRVRSVCGSLVLIPRIRTSLELGVEAFCDVQHLKSMAEVPRWPSCLHLLPAGHALRGAALGRVVAGAWL